MKETFTYGSLRTLRVKLLEVTQLCVMFKNKIRQITFDYSDYDDQQHRVLKPLPVNFT